LQSNRATQPAQAVAKTADRLSRQTVEIKRMLTVLVQIER